MPKSPSISRKSKKGLPPGSLIYAGKPQDQPVKFEYIMFQGETFSERTFTTFSQCMSALKTEGVHWINVDGLHDVDKIADIGQRFGIHPLTLEDVLNTQSRPKFEEYDGYLVVIMKMIRFDQPTHDIASEQLVIVLKDNTVLTFQEKDGGDAFDLVRHRLRQSKGRIRKHKADYLAYALMDAVVDCYFDVLENIGEAMEDLEERLIAQPSPELMQLLHHMKRQMISLRKSVWPLRELIASIERSDDEVLMPETHMYLRDLKDHIILIIDTIETYRDLLSGLMDLYLSSVSNRMNEIMKVLAVISTIFIPVTFIAGVYGMNFDVMPELHTRWGYFAVWLLMGTIMLSQYRYFRRRGWI